MVNARPRRRRRQLAATLLVRALTVSGLATAVISVGPTLWELTAPADRVSALVAEAERELAQPRTPDVATGSGAPAPSGSSAPSSAHPTTKGPVAIDETRREPFAHVGARFSVAEPTPGPSQS